MTNAIKTIQQKNFTSPCHFNVKLHCNCNLNKKVVIVGACARRVKRRDEMNGGYNLRVTCSRTSSNERGGNFTSKLSGFSPL
jgi:hypothetical protein